jgi:chorismate mutase
VPSDVDVAVAQRRSRIDEIDAELIRLWQARQAVATEVVELRLASGGTRVALAREQEILNKYRKALGPLGTEFANLLLRVSRGYR